MTLGFWTALIGRRYEDSLWTKHLHKAFLNATAELTLFTGEKKIVKMRRNDIAKRIDEIRILRNRIAHHKCVLTYAVVKTYEEIMAAIGWLCPTTANWIQSCNCFQERFRRAN
jgi:hypothetical protein